MFTLNIAELKERLKKNSTNSSKPPSTNGFTKPKSLLTPSNRKPGAKKGHFGAGLKLPHQPDERIDCERHNVHCPNAQICNFTVKESRYEIDLKTIVIVRQYRQISRTCTRFDHIVLIGEFPKNVTSTKQYGNGVKALAVALTSLGTVSIQRTHDLISAISGLTISIGSLYKMSHDFALGLTDVVESIRLALLAKKTPVHCDESGARIAGRLAS